MSIFNCIGNSKFGGESYSKIIIRRSFLQHIQGEALENIFYSGAFQDDSDDCANSTARPTGGGKETHKIQLGFGVGSRRK